MYHSTHEKIIGLLLELVPSTVWILGIEVRSSDLAAGTFTHTAILLATFNFQPWYWKSDSFYL